MNKSWTRQEEKTLWVEWRKGRTPEQIGRRLRRSPGAVRSKYGRLQRSYRERAKKAALTRQLKGLVGDLATLHGRVLTGPTSASEAARVALEAETCAYRLEDLKTEVKKHRINTKHYREHLLSIRFLISEIHECLNHRRWKRWLEILGKVASAVLTMIKIVNVLVALSHGPAGALLGFA